MMWWWDGARTWMFWPFFMFLMMAICVGIMFMMMRGGGMHRPPGREDDPLSILRQRFARGEINREEYEDRKRALSQP